MIYENYDKVKELVERIREKEWNLQCIERTTSIRFIELENRWLYDLEIEKGDGHEIAKQALKALRAKIISEIGYLKRELATL